MIIRRLLQPRQMRLTIRGQLGVPVTAPQRMTAELGGDVMRLAFRQWQASRMAGLRFCLTMAFEWNYHRLKYIRRLVYIVAQCAAMLMVGERPGTRKEKAYDV